MQQNLILANTSGFYEATEVWENKPNIGVYVLSS